MAAARLSRWTAGAAALLAAAFIAALALTGERPEAGLERFRPAGVLAGWPAEDITSVEVVAGAERRLFRRGPDGIWQADAADTARRVETGLTLLRNAAPQRVLAADEIDKDELAAMALDPPRLVVTARLRDRNALTIRFGDINPLGLARYARIDNTPGVLLLPSYVAEPWEEVMKPQ